MGKTNKFLLSLFVMAFIGAGAMAQENNNRDAQGKIVRGPYETNRFFDNIFVGIGGGVNIFRGENDSYGSFGKHLAPALDISLGKWITPSFGLRLQYSGLKANGWTSTQSMYAKGADGALFREKFGVMNLHGDLLWNISNAISGYKETRTWDFVPFVGAGWARSYGNGHYKNEFATTIGLLNVVRLCKVVDLTLEARYMFVNQRFDGVVHGSRVEGMASVTVGLSFNLGQKRFVRKSVVVPADYSAYDKQIEALTQNNSALTDKAAKLAAELEAAKNRKAETITVTTVTGENLVTASPVALFFGLNKATLDSKELTNLEFYVHNAMKADKNKTFTLIGSADKETGNKTINQKLSEQRLEYVYNLLVNKYGIDAKRLVKRAEGDTKNRFAEPLLNRVVIVE
ncbi:MAG: OmpA family protein [Alistipes sp.]